MVDMEMRQRDVRDRLPIVAALGEPTGDPAAAVDEQAEVIRLDEIAGAASTGRQRDGSGSQRGETHDHGPLNRIFLDDRTPSATNTAMYTPGGTV